MNKYFSSSKETPGNGKRTKHCEVNDTSKKILAGDHNENISQSIRAKANSRVLSEGTSAEIRSQLEANPCLNKTVKSTEGGDHPIRANKDEMNEMPLTEKYGSLLGPYVQLPPTYQKLSSLFKITDSTLNFARLRDIQPIFLTLRQSIAENYKATIKVSHIQQFLTILPNCYKLEWIHKTYSKSFDLLVEFPETLKRIGNQISSDEIVKRSNEFNKELKKMKDQNTTAPEIQETPLPEKPNVERVQSVKLFVREMQDRKNAANEAIKNYIKNTPMVSDETPLIAGVSREIALRIREKEKILKQSQEHLLDECTLEKHQKIEKLSKMCTLLKSMFLTQKCPTIFLILLIKKLKDTRKLSDNPTVIERDLNEVIELFPNWLSRYDTNSGIAIRMNREQIITNKHISDKLQAKYFN